MTKKDRAQIVENAINEYLDAKRSGNADATQWAAIWYVGGMISGALVMIAFLNS